MFMGKGVDLSFSINQKLNTANSMEAELVSINDAPGLIMWVKYFMKEQGYTIDSNILFQDNKSTILLAKNGRSLAGKKSKHINNCYFLITDKVQREIWRFSTSLLEKCWLAKNQKLPKVPSSAGRGQN